MVVAAPVSVPLIVTFLNPVVLLPPTELVPLKVTVPLLLVKVPLLDQFPATFIFADDGPVSVPEMVRLLNELVEPPEMVDVPLNVTVPLL